MKPAPFHLDISHIELTKIDYLCHLNDDKYWHVDYWKFPTILDDLYYSLFLYSEGFSVRWFELTVNFKNEKLYYYICLETKKCTLNKW